MRCQGCPTVDGDATTPLDVAPPLATLPVSANCTRLMDCGRLSAAVPAVVAVSREADLECWLYLVTLPSPLAAWLSLCAASMDVSINAAPTVARGLNSSVGGGT